MTPEKSGSFALINNLSDASRQLLKKIEDCPKTEIMNSEALRIVRSVWPDAFYVSSPKPLKTGIHKDMEATQLLPPHIISIALRFFTTLECYLETIKPKAIRISLDGKPAGKVKLREAVDAEIKLFNLYSISKDKDANASVRDRVIIKKITLIAVRKQVK